jgi:hypothetical protein
VARYRDQRCSGAACHTVAVSYEVTVTAELRTVPTPHVVDVLADHFGAVAHERGSKALRITEHVAMSDEADALAFVRQLVAEALPDGAKITSSEVVQVG